MIGSDPGIKPIKHVWHTFIQFLKARPFHTMEIKLNNNETAQLRKKMCEVTQNFLDEIDPQIKTIIGLGRK